MCPSYFSRTHHRKRVVPQHSAKNFAATLERYQPAVVVVNGATRPATTTAEEVMSILREGGTNMRSIPWDITVPRRGWVVLVPRVRAEGVAQ